MDRKAKPVLILGVAVVLLFVLSFFGWEELSGGLFKSYDMLADVRPGGSNVEVVHQGNEYLDPDLLALQEREDRDDTKYEYIDEEEPEDEKLPGETLDENEITDETAVDESEAEPVETQETASSPSEPTTPSETTPVAGAQPEKGANPRDVTPAAKTTDAKVAATQGIVDYSSGHTNLKKLKAALADTPNKLHRIAVIGDSYIEGDIFTEWVRELLQDKYGGQGIGYTPLYSASPGFRRSLTHSLQGLSQLDFRNSGSKKMCLIQGVASRADSAASVTFSGSNKLRHADKWSRTLLLLKVPRGGQLRIKSGKGKEGEWTTHKFDASDNLQTVTLDGETSRISITGITPGIVFQGAYLDGDKGIAVDNMSIRGYSGIRHNEIDGTVTAQARPDVDYDLIVLEYGINALNSKRQDYKVYGDRMIKVINHLKELYPKAVVLVMAIGDRGEKVGGEVHSMSTAPYMVEEQRRIAQETGSLFWDTRAAMGGDDAVVEWVKNKDLNKDYIHMSFAGGRRLAKLFVNDLEAAVK